MQMYTIYKNIDRKYFLIESNIKLILLNTIKFLSILIFENLRTTDKTKN